MMLKIGVTGGIGTGKTTVCRLFELLKVPVYYADKEAKKLLTFDPLLKAQIKQVFGQEVYKGDQLNRRKLSEMVFNDQFALKKLNSLVHPAVQLDFENWTNKQNAPYLIKEAALLFESGSANKLDEIISVYAPAELRIKRLLKRDNATREEIKKRIANQMDEDKKRSLADYVINNDDEHALIPQVMELHKEFIRIGKL